MQKEGSQSVPPLTPPHLLHQGLKHRHRICSRVFPLVRGAALHAFEVCRLATWGGYTADKGYDSTWSKTLWIAKRQVRPARSSTY